MEHLTKALTKILRINVCNDTKIYLREEKLCISLQSKILQFSAPPLKLLTRKELTENECELIERIVDENMLMLKRIVWKQLMDEQRKIDLQINLLTRF